MAKETNIYGVISIISFFIGEYFRGQATAQCNGGPILAYVLDIFALGIGLVFIISLFVNGEKAIIKLIKLLLYLAAMLVIFYTQFSLCF